MASSSQRSAQEAVLEAIARIPEHPDRFVEFDSHWLTLSVIASRRALGMDVSRWHPSWLEQVAGFAGPLIREGAGL